MKFLLINSVFLILSQCGTFDASYTDKQGVTYHGGIVAPKMSETADAK